MIDKNNQKFRTDVLLEIAIIYRAALAARGGSTNSGYLWLQMRSSVIFNITQKRTAAQGRSSKG